MKKIVLLFVSLLFLLNVRAQEKQVLTSDSVKLFINVKGKGTPCLYLHGGPGSGSYWLEKLFGDYLEQHFQMIYLDQRGVGRSSTPKDGNYSMERLINDFEEIRKELGIKKWVTLGHSFGGILQMGYIDRYPDAITGMIMINCTLSMEESFCSSWLPKAAEFTGNKYSSLHSVSSDSLLIKLMEASKELNAKKMTWKMAFSSPENEIKMNSTYNEIPNWNNNFSSVALTIKDYWIDYRKITPEVKRPVLFFYGRSDWSVGPEHYNGVKFPDMILWGSNVGHMPFLDNRADLEKAVTSYIRKYKL